jgi:hypothetical protein
MCFSATASFSAASITAVIGIATLRQVKHPRELPLAAMPLLFARRRRSLAAITGGWRQGRSRCAVLVFSGLCQSPVASLRRACSASDRDLRRRQVLYALGALGSTISLYMLNRLIENPPPVAICGHSIDHGGNEYALSWHTFLYLLCTCVPLLLSSSGAIRRFGARCGDRLPGLRHHLFRDLHLGLVFLCRCRQRRSLLLFQECRAACVAS